MSSVNNTNTINSWSNKGMSGLVSGMDTESIVQKLLMKTQSKIDKQTGLKQQTLWKQERYRTVTSSLLDFQKSYFNHLKPETNLLSSSFYNAKRASSSSDALSVIAGSNVSNSSMTVDFIHQLAQAQKEQGANTVSGDVSLDVDASKLQEGQTINITFNNVTRTFTLNGKLTDGTSSGTAENSSKAILENLQHDIKKVFGNDLKIDTDTGAMSTASDSQFIVNGSVESLATLGLKDSISNKVSLNTSLKDLTLRDKLVGDKFEFSINGEKFSFTSDATLDDVMRTVNTSKANVKMTYSYATDKFAIESTASGADINIEMKQTSGNLLTSMFGVGSGSSVGSEKKQTIGFQATNPSGFPADFMEGKFSFNVNDTEHSVNIGKKDDGTAYNLDEVVTKLNEHLAVGFGAGKISLANSGGQISIATAAGMDVSFNADNGTDLQSLLGFTKGQSSDISGGNKMWEMGLDNGSLVIGGQTFAYSLNTSIQDFMDQVNASGRATISLVDNKFEITSNEAELEISGSFAEKVFGEESSFKLNTATTDTLELTKGQNAILSVNGQQIERRNNEFTIDGYQLSLKKTTATVVDSTTGNISAAPTADAIKITAENNNDQIFDGIVKFVNDYNKMIESITKMTSEKITHNKYAPLTAEQKAAMKDNEIELWEEKAQGGLMNNDSLLMRVAGELRNQLYNSPEGEDIALYTIGITTGKYNDNGKLKIDEEKLKQAIAEDPEAIQKLFTDPKTGIATSINRVIDEASKTSIATPGYLVQRAGFKDTTSETKNHMQKQMDDIDKTVLRLKKTYDMEKARYWKQFSALEKVISQTNSQSSWLSQQFS